LRRPRIGEPPRIVELAVDAPLTIDDLEVVGQLGNALAGAEEQDALANEREAEQAEHLLLRRDLQVDEHVAAAHQVHPRERRIADGVVPREDDHRTKLGPDLPALPAAHEVAFQALGGDAEHRLGAVDARRCRLQRARVHVGGEDLHQPAAHPRRHLLQEHRQRVDLLAGGAARHPDAERSVRVPLREQLGQHAVLEDVERLLVAEEPGHPDEQVAVEDVQLLARARQAFHVGRQVVDARQLQAALDAAGDGARLVVGEVDPELLLEHGVDRREPDGGPFRVRERQRWVGAGMLGEHGGHLFRWQHARLDGGIERGTRHGIELGAVRVLDQDQTSGLVDVLHATRAIAAAPGQDDGHGARATVLGQRPKEDVDGEVQLRVRTSLRQQQSPGGDDHHLLARDQIDVVRADLDAVLHVQDGHGGVPGQQLVHRALEVGRQVLHEHEGHAAVGRQLVEEALDGVQSAGGGTDAHHVRRRWMRHLTWLFVWLHGGR
jgi:hypothetical protein